MATILCTISRSGEKGKKQNKKKHICMLVIWMGERLNVQLQWQTTEGGWSRRGMGRSNAGSGGRQRQGNEEKTLPMLRPIKLCDLYFFLVVLL
jgi:hypothetical protein